MGWCASARPHKHTRLTAATKRNMVNKASVKPRQFVTELLFVAAVKRVCLWRCALSHSLNGCPPFRRTNKNTLKNQKQKQSEMTRFDHFRCTRVHDFSLCFCFVFLWFFLGGPLGLCASAPRHQHTRLTAATKSNPKTNNPNGPPKTTPSQRQT